MVNWKFMLAWESGKLIYLLTSQRNNEDTRVQMGDNIKINLGELEFEGLDWSNLAQDNFIGGLLWTH
jgi:hypothetical protein